MAAKLEDPEIRKKLLTRLRMGVSRRVAAKALRIAISTIANEAQRDAEFRADLEAAEAQAECLLVTTWFKMAVGATKKTDPKPAAKRDWISIAAFLGRKWPKRWGRNREAPQNDADDDSDSISADDFVEATPAMVAATLPSGAVPTLAELSAVQDSARGSTQREDGAVQTVDDSEAVGLPSASPAVEKSEILPRWSDTGPGEGNLVGGHEGDDPPPVDPPDTGNEPVDHDEMER